MIKDKNIDSTLESYIGETEREMHMLRSWNELEEVQKEYENIKTEDVDQKKLEQGFYCRKDNAGCFCLVGFPVEYQCPDCRDIRSPGFNNSRCVCPPNF